MNDFQKENKAMKTINKMQIKFLSNISDEIKNPLNDIVSLIKTFEKEQSSKVNTKNKRELNKAFEIAENLNKKVSLFLDLASIELEQYPLSLGTFDIKEMLNELLEIVVSKINDDNKQLNFKCQENIGWIVGDVKKIKQVLYYMIGYVVNSSAIENTIEFFVTKERSENLEKCVVFYISGNINDSLSSSQINEDEKSKAWYETNDDSDEMIRKIVSLHNGKIDINKENKKNSITISLPTNS